MVHLIFLFTTSDSGPLVAGVIRSEKFRFQLFGDAMNLASRMESTGSPGRIQLSEDTATILEAAGKGSWLIKRDGTLDINVPRLPIDSIGHMVSTKTRHAHVVAVALPLPFVDLVQVKGKVC